MTVLFEYSGSLAWYMLQQINILKHIHLNLLTLKIYLCPYSFAIILTRTRELVACFNCISVVLWLSMFCGSSSRFPSLVCSVWLWYFLIIHYFQGMASKWRLQILIKMLEARNIGRFDENLNIWTMCISWRWGCGSSWPGVKSACVISAWSCIAYYFNYQYKHDGRQYK